MSEIYRTRLLLEVSQPERAKKPDIGNPYEEGKHLPNSVEEDIGSFSLCPSYSSKQLRRIKRVEFSPNEKERTRKPKWKDSRKTQKRIHLTQRLRGGL